MSGRAYGLTHPTWFRPECFDFDSASEAQAAILRTYGPDSGHVVVGPVADLAAAIDTLADHLAHMDRAGGGIYTADFRDGFRLAVLMLGGAA